jgi:hypothetical protein
VVELGVIKRIEQLAAELDSRIFISGEVFLHANVQVVHARSKEEITSGRAKIPNRRGSEAASIELASTFWSMPVIRNRT